MGSIGSGGRYANLTEMFGGRDMSGVGISFGVERIYDIMEELKLFPQDALKTTEILFVHFSEANRDFAFPLVQQLREANVSVELYPDKAKMEKQMKYANAKGIPYVVVIGDNEMLSGKLAVKDMRSGTQEEKTFAELLAFFTEKK
jgi:histidyl-tRNA synthetase